MKKVIYLFGGVVPNGFANSYQALKTVEALNIAGDTTTLFVQSDVSPDEIRRAYDISIDFPLVIFSKTNHLILNVHMMRELWRRRHEYQIVYTRETLFVYTILCARFLLGKKIVFEAHRYSSRSLIDKLRRYILVRSVHGIVVISKGLRDLFKRHVHKPIALAFCGVDPRRFEKLPEKQAIRRELGLPLESRIVAYVGSLQEYEGVEFLLRAFSKFDDKEARLVVVGGTKAQQAVLREKVADERVVWRGRVSFGDVPGYYAAADVLAAPLEKNEPGASPVKMFEYMFARRPIVASEIPPIQEVLSDGKSAYLFTLRDERAFGGALKKALSLGAHVADRALQESGEYTFERRAHQIKEVFEKIS